MTRTVDTTGAKSVNIKTTGHEKSHFTVVLACCASGDKLPPMCIFKLKRQPKEKMPAGVVVTQNEKGWMNNSVMEKWLESCYSRRPDGFFKTKKALLVLDSMRAHISPEVKEAIKKTNSVPAVIPGGLTKQLQPLDISVNRSFKNQLRKQWEQWMTSGEHSFTATGRMRRATYAQVVEWVKVAWDRVDPAIIKSGFQKAGLWQYQEPEVEFESESEAESEAECTPTTEQLCRWRSELFNDDSDDEDFEGFTSD